jgi:hypothetical protein
VRIASKQFIAAITREDHAVAIALDTLLLGGLEIDGH